MVLLLLFLFLYFETKDALDMWRKEELDGSKANSNSKYFNYLDVPAKTSQQQN